MTEPISYSDLISFLEMLCFFIEFDCQVNPIIEVFLSRHGTFFFFHLRQVYNRFSNTVGELFIVGHNCKSKLNLGFLSQTSWIILRSVTRENFLILEVW